MFFRSSQAARKGYCALAAIFLTHGIVHAHVVLNSPIGGESLDGGFTFPIQWQPVVQHGTIDWDLWYSTDGPTGPWIEIAADIPVGDPTAGALHNYDWDVPNVDIADAWVRVRQDNSGQDYYSVSTFSFLVEAALSGDFTGNKIVDGDDLLVWENGFGANSGALFTNGDGDSDGDVDGADYLLWQRNYANQSAASVFAPVPEPHSLLLLLFGAAGLMICRRW